MKRLYVCGAALLLLVAPALSMAQQPPPQQQQQHRQGGGRPPAGRPGPQHVPPRAPPPNAQVHPGTRPMPGRPPVAGTRPYYGHGAYHPPRGNSFYYGGRYYNRVRGGPWAWPPGYGYRRFYVGGILPAIFLGSAYIYANYAALGLAPPSPGFVWVRYGPDLVLVNQATGQIVNVAYGAFL